MSRHKCSKELYRAFLQASSIRYTGLALSEVSPIKLSHDSISRWLKDQRFRPREIWEIAKGYIDPTKEGLLIIDDTILEKHYSKKIELTHYQYSGNVHGVTLGIGLVNLIWRDYQGDEFIPIDYRIYDKPTDDKTKNEHVCDMLNLVKQRGVKPKVIVMDSWYSSLSNLKCIRSHEWLWVAGLKKNRKVNRNITLEDLDIPEEGQEVHLRGYGFIKVFKFVAPTGRIDYIGTNQIDSSRSWVEGIMKARWSVEVFHREIKQTCGIERCQARTGRAQRNHICLVFQAWLQQHQRRMQQGMSFYQQKWNVIKDSISTHIRALLFQPIF